MTITARICLDNLGNILADVDICMCCPLVHILPMIGKSLCNIAQWSCSIIIVLAIKKRQWWYLKERRLLFNHKT